MRYILLFVAAFNLFARCEESFEKVYPADATRFAEDFILAIKTEQPYDAYRDTLARIDLDKLKTDLVSAEQKLAFWINTYNSMVQAKIRDDVKQFEDRDKFFKSEDQTLGGVKLSLDQIENGILRRQEMSSNKEFIENFKVNKIDPRIHFTLNCGASSCPPVAYYSVDRLDSDLASAEESFVTQTSKYDETTNTLEISELFKWFEEDFGGKEGVLAVMQRLSILPKDTDPTITYTTYNWNLDIDNF